MTFDVLKLKSKFLILSVEFQDLHALGSHTLASLVSPPQHPASHLRLQHNDFLWSSNRLSCYYSIQPLLMSFLPQKYLFPAFHPCELILTHQTLHSYNSPTLLRFLGTNSSQHTAKHIHVYMHSESVTPHYFCLNYHLGMFHPCALYN